jgi:hypothetical protein
MQQNATISKLGTRGNLLTLPPSLAAPSDPPFAAPPSPETKPRKKERAFSNHNYRHYNFGNSQGATGEMNMPYLSDGGLDALVLHQLRHHRPANDTNLVVSGKATHTFLASNRQHRGLEYLSMETRWAAWRPSLRNLPMATAGRSGRRRQQRRLRGLRGCCSIQRTCFRTMGPYRQEEEEA